MKEEFIKITVETEKTKDTITLLEDNILIDGKEATISDCIFWRKVFQNGMGVVDAYVRDTIANTINNITKH